ncbi:MAG: hypothetical protein NZ108_10150 [Bacteroidia bacterium]|nr:hypothetical protein [Bacteroidia bacterium]
MSTRMNPVQLEELYEKVQAIINEIDPVGLIDLGCPQDEYEPEIKNFLPKLHGKSRSEIQEIVYKVFSNMFDEEAGENDERYAEIAERLYRLYQEIEGSFEFKHG